MMKLKRLYNQKIILKELKELNTIKNNINSNP